MEVRCDAVIPFPRDLVYRTYRDHLVDLLPYLPNIREIEVESREEDGGIVRLVNVWRGGGDIPKIARAVISESALSWTDHALWDESRWMCEWRVEPHSFTDAVTSAGRNDYLEVPDGTRLQIRGDLTLDAARIRGVPRLLAGKVSRAAEEFIVRSVSKNLQDVSRGVTRYLEDRESSA